MVDKKMSFGRLLKEFMEISHIKAPQISKITKYEISTIYKWTKGERLPSQSNIDEIAAALSKYFISREERAKKLMHTLVNEQNLAHETDCVAELSSYALEEVFLNAFDFSLQTRKKITNKKHNIPLYFKECQNTFMVSSYSNLVKAYIFFFDELAASPSANKNIMVVTGTFDEYAVVSRSARVMLEKMAGLSEKGYKVEWIMLVDKSKHGSANMVTSLLNVLGFMGKNSVDFRFAEKSHATNFCDKVFIAEERVAAETVSISGMAPEVAFITYDRNIVDALYASYQSRLLNLKRVFEEIDIFDYSNNFSSLLGGRYCSLSRNMSVSLLQLDFLLRGELDANFSGIVKKIKENNYLWEQYSFASKESYYLLNIEGFNKFVFDGEVCLGEESVFCSIKMRIAFLENILDSLVNNSCYKLALYNDKDDNIVEKISNVIIFNKKDACMRLKNNKYNWLKVNDEYFVAGMESYFSSLFAKAFEKEINNRDGLIELLENNIMWLKSQQS